MVVAAINISTNDACDLQKAVEAIRRRRRAHKTLELARSFAPVPKEW
jgi:hypothetical protein